MKWNNGAMPQKCQGLCSIEEVTYWYNVIPKLDTSPLTAPANQIYKYKVWLKESESVPPMMSEVGDLV